MTEGEIETLILHEEGELAGPDAGRRWTDKLAGLGGKRAEIFARAVKDNLADCLVTLPGLLARGGGDSLHFWFSTFDGLRREMFPRLLAAYGSRVGAGDTAILAVAKAGQAHFLALARRLLEMDESAIEALSHEVGSIAL
jgi:hypothetical protein